MSRWFRHYAGLARDEKLVSVAIKSKQTVERVVWVWAAILESATEIDDGGRFSLDTGEAAYFLRADEADIVAITSALSDVGRVVESVVVNWGRRQFQSDKSRDRVATHRQRKRDSACDLDNEATLQHEPVTLQKRYSNPPETETETETETTHSARAREIEFRQAIASEYTHNGFPPPETGRAVVWLGQGRKPEICLAVISDGLKRKKKFLPLQYFDGPIADAHAKPPDGQARAGPQPKSKDPYAARIAELMKGQPNEPDFTGTTIDQPSIGNPPRLAFARI